MAQQIKAPGLKWRSLASGPCPVWVADENDVRNGYSPKTFNLRHLADQPDMLVAQCNALQADMILWRTGFRREPLTYDGTLRSLIDIYQIHEESPYRKLKPATLRPYNHYLGKLRAHIGALFVADISGVDVVRWHRLWSNNGEHLAAASMARAVLEAVVQFGVMLRKPGCAELITVLRETRKKLPRPISREVVITSDEVTAARRAAHADGRKSRALAYAIAYETTLRLWDVIGQWLPMSRPDFSDVIDAERGEKWVGLRWEDIGPDMWVSFTPSKTEDRTGSSIRYPLAKAPMVLDELQHWPIETRKGPLIVSEVTGLPYLQRRFAAGWAKDRKAAGIPVHAWARDLRASGISEGRASDASLDDASKVAGHAGTKTTGRVYDRAIVEAADRFATARVTNRERGGNSGGNER